MSTHHASHSGAQHGATPTHFSAAFAETASARAAISDDDLVPITLDIQAAVATVIGTLPRLAKLRESIAKLPGIDVERLDRLKTFAEALFFSNVEFLAASGTGEALPKLAARAVELRDLLLTDAAALAKRGLIDTTELAQIKRLPGYLNTATDLSIIVSVLRAHWNDIGTKTAVQPADLEEATTVYGKITRAFGARSNVAVEATAAADARIRAYTLMVGAYDQARRAVSFLRWNEGDVDAIVPSLYGGRTRSAKPADATSTTPASADATPIAAAPKPVIADAHAATPSPSPTTQAAPGHPGSSPFSSN